VGEDDQAGAQTHGRLWRRVAVAIAACIALLVIFHRPLLLGLGRQIALHYAAREHLKADFRLEGNVFTALSVRHLHVVPIGSTDVESVDVDLARADYSLLALLLHGPSQLLKNLEAHSARIVLNPTEVPLKPRPLKIHERIRLPAIFPDRVRLSDVTLIVRNKPHDFVIEHVDLELDPHSPGELSIDKLQLPAGQSWTKISAQTSYTNRNLILRDLVLDNEDRFRALNIDASQISAKTLAINIDGAIGGGTLSGSITLNQTRSSLNTKVHLLGETIAAAALNKYIGLPEKFIDGQIERVNVDLAGVLNAPSSWSGTMSAQVSNLRRQQMVFDRCVFEVSAQQGRATLRTADIVQGRNEFHLRGSAELPADIKQFGRSAATLEISAAALDLQRLTAGTPQRLTGSAQINGKIDIKNGKLDANLSASAGSIGFENGTIEKLSANLRASKIVPPPNLRKSWFADLRSAMELDISNIRYRDYLIDSVEGSLNGVDDLVSVERLHLRRKQNDLSIRGQYRLPEELRTAASQPAQLDVSLNASQMGDYWIADSPDKITGPLQMAAQIERKHGISNGQVTVFGSNLKMRDLVFKQLSLQCSISNNVIYVNDFSASLNERDFAGANGIVDLRAPYHYSGKFSANVSDLSTLEPLLAAYGNERELAGSLAIDWEGSGDAKTFKNTGKLKLTLEKGRYGDLQSLQANVDATYTPNGLDIPIIFFSSNKMDFQAIVRASGETLEITKVQLDQGTARYAAGYLSAPFIWKNLGTTAPLCPPNGKVIANFQSENIDIKKLFQDFGAKPAASGTVNVKLDAQGTLADLNARLDVQMRDLRSERLPNLEPATFDLSAQSQHDQLTISGKLQQAKIQPMELTANLPFNAAKVIRERKLADETPVTAKVRLPRSSVNFVHQFVPAIQELDGDLALDVDVSGTFGRPVFSGTGDMTVNVARSNNVTLPALRDFKARLNFARDALTVEQFGGELSGGHFTMSGRVTFPKLTAANLDLQIKADSALIARNDTLTARVDADIKVIGPISSANVTGNVAMTNSQFLKNLDLIPIGLPGRPAPQPPSSRPDFSMPQPPFRDWKFDVAIKTKDPVLIRGSLANGGAVSDLHLTGTGLRPGLQGFVRLDHVEATLPFSRLEVSSGFVYFDPSDSFNPKLDLHGTSVIHDHTIHVYIYGTSLAPEAVFTSEPPLPQEEIISLLATGTTREELTGSNNVLAGRAATLLVQQLYRKIFKKGQATQSNSIFDRLDWDAGTVDPRTGQQQATARYKINDQFVFVGDVGVGGDYRGMLKYLIRFR
jgi:autotransporter translocation and assembly factor TamB